MACINPDGTLTASATEMLRAITQPADVNQIAAATHLPLFRVRSGLREMIGAGLASEKDGLYMLADPGRGALAKAAALPTTD